MKSKIFYHLKGTMFRSKKNETNLIPATARILLRGTFQIPR